MNRDYIKKWQEYCEQYHLPCDAEALIEWFHRLGNDGLSF